MKKQIGDKPQTPNYFWISTTGDVTPNFKVLEVLRYTEEGQTLWNFRDFTQKVSNTKGLRVESLWVCPFVQIWTKVAQTQSYQGFTLFLSIILSNFKTLWNRRDFTKKISNTKGLMGKSLWKCPISPNFVHWRDFTQKPSNTKGLRGVLVLFCPEFQKKLSKKFLKKISD